MDGAKAEARDRRLAAGAAAARRGDQAPLRRAGAKAAAARRGDQAPLRRAGATKG